jgi:parallel beta-helix repeat protein
MHPYSGISLSRSSSNEINNNIISNNDDGILLGECGGNNISNNAMEDNGIFIRGWSIDYWNFHNIDSLNSVNGKPVYYWKDQIGGTIPNGAGQVILSNSENIIIEGQDLSHGSVGIELGFSTNIDIIDNNITSNNWYGIYLSRSDTNFINGNTITGNDEEGIYLIMSDGNNISTNFVSNNIRGIEIGVSYDNIVFDNVVNSNVRTGITVGMTSESNTVVSNNLSSNGWDAIEIGHSIKNKIINNTLTSEQSGVKLWDRSNFNTVSGNVIWDSSRGISLSSSYENNVSENNISYCREGILLFETNNNNISDNVISFSDEWGMRINDSTSIGVFANEMIENGIYFEGDLIEYWNTHSIDILNTVNAKPVYYLSNQTGGTVPYGAGQVILANCTNVMVENQELNNSDIGVEIGFSTGNTIVNNTISFHNKYGLYAYSSNNNSIDGNNISENDCGIYLDNSSGSNITNNSIFDCLSGIRLYRNSNESKIKQNRISECSYGIYLYQSGKNNLFKNELIYGYRGIYLVRCSGNNLSENNILFSTWNGISLESTDWNNITYNILSENRIGIHFFESSNNSLHHNNFINNQDQIRFNDLNSVGNIWNNGFGEGNYWSDYTGLDDGNNGRIAGDGVGDTEIQHPYIDQGHGYFQLDNYPLMDPIPDTLPPRIKLISPINNSSIISGVILDFDVYDTNLHSVDYTLNDSTAQVLPSPYNISTVDWLDGNYEILIEATDENNNLASQIFFFIIDTIPPVINITGPLNNSIIPTGTILELSILDSNLELINYSINGDSDITISEPYNISTNGWDDGDYIVKVNALDMAGNMNSKMYYFTIDSTPPSISMDPGLNHSVIAVGKTIHINISDPHTNTVMYSLDGGDYLDLTSPYVIDTSGWTHGLHTITVFANDTAQNEALFWFEVTIDATPPEVLDVDSAHSFDYSANTEEITINFMFSEAMNQSNSEDYVSISPSVDYDLEWDATGTILSVSFITEIITEETQCDVTISWEITDENGTPMDYSFISSFMRLPSQDSDGDGIPDEVDDDDDNDGHIDEIDAFPLNNLEWTDTDMDGLGDNADSDDDNDGHIDEIDAFPLDELEWIDTDDDGTGDNTDSDDDNDGILDLEDAFPLNATEWTDTDGDGTGNNADLDDDNDGHNDAEDAYPLDPDRWQDLDLDTDGDGTPDIDDTDDDNDGYLDGEDAFPLNSLEWRDTDSDGIGNNADPDDDNDGRYDEVDAYPLDPELWKKEGGTTPMETIWVLMILVIILITVVLLMLIVKKKGKEPVKSTKSIDGENIDKPSGAEKSKEKKQSESKNLPPPPPPPYS